MEKPSSVQVSLDLKLVKITGTWQPTKVERDAAWELYVELVTRVGVVVFREGLLREALASVHAIFPVTREILRKYGPEVAPAKSLGELNFGYLAVSLLNYVLRPLLSTWHPLLLDWESRMPTTETSFSHEVSWARSTELRDALQRTAVEMRYFIDTLAVVCGVPNLIVPPAGIYQPRA